MNCDIIGFVYDIIKDKIDRNFDEKYYETA